MSSARQLRVQKALAKKKCFILDQPDEILSLIFSHLNLGWIPVKQNYWDNRIRYIDSIRSWRLTCRKFREISEDLQALGNLLLRSFKKFEDLFWYYPKWQRGKVPLSEDLDLLLYLDRPGMNILGLNKRMLNSYNLTTEKQREQIFYYFLKDHQPEQDRVDERNKSYLEEFWRIPMMVLRRKKISLGEAHNTWKAWNKANDLFSRLLVTSETDRNPRELELIRRYLQNPVLLPENVPKLGNILIGSTPIFLTGEVHEVHDKIHALYPFLDRNNMCIEGAESFTSFIQGRFNKYRLRYWPQVERERNNIDKHPLKEWLHDRDPIVYRL